MDGSVAACGGCPPATGCAGRLWETQVTRRQRLCDHALPAGRLLPMPSGVPPAVLDPISKPRSVRALAGPRSGPPEGGHYMEMKIRSSETVAVMERCLAASDQVVARDSRFVWSRLKKVPRRSKRETLISAGMAGETADLKSTLPEWRSSTQHAVCKNSKTRTFLGALSAYASHVSATTERRPSEICVRPDRRHARAFSSPTTTLRCSKRPARSLRTISRLSPPCRTDRRRSTP